MVSPSATPTTRPSNVAAIPACAHRRGRMTRIRQKDKSMEATRNHEGFKEYYQLADRLITHYG